MRKQPKLFILATMLLCASSHGWELEEVNYALGTPINVMYLRGVYLETLLNGHYAVQLQAYKYEEFQVYRGVLNLPRHVPPDGYNLFGINAGYYWKSRRGKIGALTGLNHIDGVVRGDFLRSDTGSILSRKIEYYEEVKINSWVFPLRLVAGWYWPYFGINMGPQFYFMTKRIFWNFTVNVEVGKL